MNVLLVKNQSQVKQLRTHLERSDYYDNTRCIQRVSSTTNDRMDEQFALPVTSSFVSHLSPLAPLPAPYSDCTLSHAHLPPSKREKAKSQTPFQVLRETVRQYLMDTRDGCSREDVGILLSDLPRCWERHGDLIVLPENSFKDPRWQIHLQQSKKEVEFEKNNGPKSLVDMIATALHCTRIAIDRRVSCDFYRSSGASLLLGQDGWVEHTDNGVRYVFDVTKCMFSSGNISEKFRVANFDCQRETVVDLYAGVGYFTLPYLVHSGAAMVHACEWNIDAVEALMRGLLANKVQDRCLIHHGDNKKVAPVGVADRVNLGLVPSSEGGWPVACRALKPGTGGWLHVHGNVSSKRTNSELSIAERNPWEAVPLVEGSEKCTDLSNTKVSQEVDCVQKNLIFGTISNNDHEKQNLPSECKETKTEVKQEIWRKWAHYVAKTIEKMLARENPLEGKHWNVIIGQIEHVKSYAPHVDHIVVDLECRPIFL